MTNTFEMPSLTVEDYHIGWVCALPKEMTAALSMLDEEHPILGNSNTITIIMLWAASTTTMWSLLACQRVLMG